MSSKGHIFRQGVLLGEGLWRHLMKQPKEREPHAAASVLFLHLLEMMKILAKSKYFVIDVKSQFEDDLGSLMYPCIENFGFTSIFCNNFPDDHLG